MDRETTLTRFWLLGNDVSDIISRTCAKHLSKTLGTLHALSVEAVATIGWLFTMSDQIHCVLRRNGSQDDWENEAGDTHIEIVEMVVVFFQERLLKIAVFLFVEIHNGRSFLYISSTTTYYQLLRCLLPRRSSDLFASWMQFVRCYRRPVSMAYSTLAPGMPPAA